MPRNALKAVPGSRAWLTFNSSQSLQTGYKGITPGPLGVCRPSVYLLGRPTLPALGWGGNRKMPPFAQILTVEPQVPGNPRVYS